MDFLPVFIKMVELFLIIIIGYVATKLKVLNEVIKTSLTKLILNITMPCTILASVLTSNDIPDNKKILVILGVASASYVIFFFLSKLTSFSFRFKGGQKGVAEFVVIFANVGFIGFPVTYAIFGAPSGFYTTIFNMPFNFICYSYGIYILESSVRNLNNKNEKVIKSSEEKKKNLRKILLNPGLIASIACIALAMIKPPLPAFIGDTCSIVGGITTPGALLIIGMSLAELPFTKMWTNVRAYIVSLICVILTPVVIYLAFKGLNSYDSLLVGEAVIISAMPAATAGTMLCVEYGGDETFMAQITFISTLISIVTIPLIATIL